MKRNLFLLFIYLFACINVVAQEEKIELKNATYPIFPGCQKKKTNEQLKECFQNKMIYELRDVYSLNSKEFEKEENINPVVILSFDLNIDGKVDNFSYTKNSNATVATIILKALYKIFKEYEERGKEIKPATINGKAFKYKVNLILSRD